MAKKKVPDATLLRWIREHFADREGGGHFRTSGRDQLARRMAGMWYVWDDEMTVVRSARGDGIPDESLRDLAKRLDLFEHQE